MDEWTPCRDVRQDDCERGPGASKVQRTGELRKGSTLAGNLNSSIEGVLL